MVFFSHRPPHFVFCVDFPLVVSTRPFLLWSLDWVPLYYLPPLTPPSISPPGRPQLPVFPFRSGFPFSLPMYANGPCCVLLHSSFQKPEKGFSRRFTISGHTLLLLCQTPPFLSFSYSQFIEVFIRLAIFFLVVPWSEKTCLWFFFLTPSLRGSFRLRLRLVFFTLSEVFPSFNGPRQMPPTPLPFLSF